MLFYFSFPPSLLYFYQAIDIHEKLKRILEKPNNILKDQFDILKPVLNPTL